MQTKRKREMALVVEGALCERADKIVSRCRLLKVSRARACRLVRQIQKYLRPSQ